MPNLNRVLLMGNLTRDPEMRFTPSNMAIAKIGIAVNRRWRNQAGEQQDEVTYLDCDAFGKTAEMINQYFRKGRPIFIEGRLKLDQWQDKEGHQRSKVVVVIESFQFVDSKQSGEAGGPPPSDAESGNYAPTRSAPRAPAPARSGPASEPHPPVPEGDIPF